jgi:hypothetical protein
MKLSAKKKNRDGLSKLVCWELRIIRESLEWELDLIDNLGQLQ